MLEEKNTKKMIEFLKKQKGEAYTGEELLSIIGEFKPHGWQLGGWEIVYKQEYYYIERKLFRPYNLITTLLIILFFFFLLNLLLVLIEKWLI